VASRPFTNHPGAARHPSFSTVEALRAWSHERNSKIAYMEAVDFIDAIFEFLKKEGWLRH
jgi:hypothetical protein